MSNVNMISLKTTLLVVGITAIGAALVYAINKK